MQKSSTLPTSHKGKITLALGEWILKIVPLQLQPLSHAQIGVWMQEVEEDGEQRACRVHPERHPPQKLLVQALFEVLKNDQAQREARQRPCQVCHVRHGQPCRLVRISVVDCVAHVGARCRERGRRLVEVNDTRVETYCKGKMVCFGVYKRMI